MADSYTKTSTEGWGSRLKGSIKGIIGGFLALAIGLGLLFWNEGRTVKNARALEEGKAQVESIDPNGDVDSFHGKLIHFTGKTETKDTLNDSQFRIKVSGLLLQRNVFMFQWVEKQEEKKEKKLGGSEETITSFTYEKRWLDKIENSNEFDTPEEHKNPDSMPFQKFIQISGDALVGNVKLTQDAISLLPCPQGLELSTQNLQLDSTIQKRGNEFFIGKGTWENPAIGDIKISYTYIPNQEISIVAQLHNRATTEFVTSNERGIFLADCGTKNSQSMFASAIASNKTMGWILRGVGFLLLFFGFSMIFKVFSVLADLLPFLGNIVEFGFGIVSGVLSLVVGLITIAIAWLYFRPWFAAGLIAIAVGLIVFLIMRKKKNELA